MVEKTLESPLDYKEIQPIHHKENQSWMFIGRNNAEVETPILWPPDGRIDSFEEALILWKIGGRRRRGQQRMRWLVGITDSITWVWINSGSWWWTGKPGVLQSMGWQRFGHDWATEWNWTGLCSPRNFQGQNTEVGSCTLLQGIFPTQGLNTELFISFVFERWLE